MRKRIVTTIEEKLIRELKIKAAELDMNVNDLLEELIKKLVNKEITINGKE